MSSRPNSSSINLLCAANERESVEGAEIPTNANIAALRTQGLLLSQARTRSHQQLWRHGGRLGGGSDVVWKRANSRPNAIQFVVVTNCCHVGLWHSSTVHGAAPILPLSGGKPTFGGRGHKGRSCFWLCEKTSAAMLPLIFCGGDHEAVRRRSRHPPIETFKTTWATWTLGRRPRFQ